MKANAVRKEDVHSCWNEIPEWFQAGDRIDQFEENSLEYFEEGRRLRYLPERFECILDFVDWESYKNSVVLEIGTGQGYDFNEIVKAGGHGIGGDLSIRNCLSAKRRLAAYGRKAQHVTFDAERIPLADNSVDHIYSFGVLHHTPFMHQSFSEVERVLKPGGTVTMMLYRKSSSLWRFQCMYLGWLFLKTVQFDFMKRFYRRLGEVFRIKSFLDDNMLDGFQRVAREGGHSLDQICGFMTDGPTNPLSQFVDPVDIRKGFPNLKAEEFQNGYLGPVPFINLLIPSSVRRFLGKHIGGFLFFRLRKPLTDANKALAGEKRSQPLSDQEFHSLLVDPIEKKPLNAITDQYAEAQSGDRYPIVDGVPVLRKEDRL